MAGELYPKLINGEGYSLVNIYALNSTKDREYFSKILKEDSIYL